MDTKTQKPDFVFRYLGQFKWKVEHVNPILANHLNIVDFQDKNIQGDVTQLKKLSLELISQLGNSMMIHFKRSGFRSKNKYDDPWIRFNSDIRDRDTYPFGINILKEMKPFDFSFNDISLMLLNKQKPADFGTRGDNYVDLWRSRKCGRPSFVQFMTELDNMELHKRLLKTEDFQNHARSSSTLIDEMMRVASEVYSKETYSEACKMEVCSDKK